VVVNQKELYKVKKLKNKKKIERKVYFYYVFLSYSLSLYSINNVELLAFYKYKALNN